MTDGAAGIVPTPVNVSLVGLALGALAVVVRVGLRRPNATAWPSIV
jgi:hypothetical protein